MAAELVKGRSLYRDVWYLYGPLAPYFNSFLFRVCGVRLEALYWAGSLSALGSAIFLYFAGRRLSYSLAGWTAGAVVLMQGFQHDIFCFPLPYAFPSVYGCLAACTMLWLSLRAKESKSARWVLAGGLIASAAFLLKLEYGTACFALLFLMLVIRGLRFQSRREILVDMLAVLPGILVCLGVVGWMISLHGLDFITQENIMSWPTSYFMRTYGRHWLEFTGMALTRSTLVSAARPTAALIIFLVLSRMALRRLPKAESWLFPVAVVGVGIVTTIVIFVPGFRSSHLSAALLAIFFPRAMVFFSLLAGALAAGWLFWHRTLQPTTVSILVLSMFSFMLAFRLLLSTYPWGYSIYYDGPVVLCFLFLTRFVIPVNWWGARIRPAWERILCIGCLASVSATAIARPSDNKNSTLLKTPRGSIRAPEKTVTAYLIAINFMKERTAQGEYVLSIPEDTSLYFLSDAECPSRVFMFTPGVIAPGKMTAELIRELESKPVSYLIWSNRQSPEYGAAVFGQDYDHVFGDYLRAHYRPLRPLLSEQESEKDDEGWSAVIWERISRSALQ